MIASIILFISMTFSVIWSLIFIPICIFNIKIHKISGQKMRTFLKQVTVASIWSNGEPDCWITGKWYFGYIYTSVGGQNEGTNKDLYICCSESFYKTIIEKKEVDETGKSTKITYYEREGIFFRLTYTTRPIDLPKRPIKEHQESAINQIIDVYNEQSYCICLLYGEPGTMKSMTAQYLCKKMLETSKEVCFVDSFNPFEQGDNFASLYTRVNPSSDRPLIIILEEIDCNISKMHSGLIQINKYIPTQIKTKTDWNGFLDKFDRGLYPNVIIIMTTNKSINYFDFLDPSYLRKGRVDLKIKF